MKDTEGEATELLKQAAELIKKAMDVHNTSLGVCINYIEKQIDNGSTKRN
jgi:hypothetical protein